MTDDDIIKLAREAGFTQKNSFSHLIVRHSNGAWVDIADDLMKFAALVVQAERESCNRKINAAWKLMCEKMVGAEREECEKAIRGVDALHAAGLVDVVLDAIRTRNRIADTSKTLAGLALDSGEFVPAERLVDWSAA